MAVRQKTSHTSLAEGGDPRVEDFLDEKGVRWEFIPNADPADFDAEKSLHNQARFETLNEAKVEAYAEAMKNGDKFPPLIASGPRTGMVIADGNHRLQAALKAKKTLGVYLLAKETPGETITLIMHEANAKHGMPTTEEERIQAALYLMENGANARTAAARLSIPQKLVVAASAKRAMDQRFMECGISLLTIEKLGEGVKRRLAAVSTDEGFIAAVDLALRANINAAEANNLAIEVNEVRSSAKQVQVVERWREDMSDRIEGSAGGTFTRAPRGPKSRVNMALGVISNLPDDLGDLGQYWQGAERDEAVKRIRASARRLNELAKALSS